jgi:lambda repressor-like predicted transcriptional regulator
MSRPPLLSPRRSPAFPARVPLSGGSLPLSHPRSGDATNDGERRGGASGSAHPRGEWRGTGAFLRNRPIAATVLIDVDHLRAEMDARGVTGRDLARETGISEGTIYNALGQRPILVRNAKLIAGALQRLEVDPGLARLVLDRGVPAAPLPPRRGSQSGGVEMDVALHHAHR